MEPITCIQCQLAGINLSQYPHQVIGERTFFYLEIKVDVSFAESSRVARFAASTLGHDIGREDLEMPLEWTQKRIICV